MIVLIVIGQRWLIIVDEQYRPRIGLGEDVRHQEIALALARPNMPVIPALDVPMPRAKS